MKSLVASFALFILSLSSYAQTYPSPEFNNEPAYYDTGTHALVGLEKSQYNKLSQAKGLMNKEAGFFLNHAKSPVRLKQSTALSFIVRVTSGTNPSTVFDLVAFEVRDDQRLIITSRTSKAGTKATTAYEKIPFDVKKVGEGVYLLTANNLKLGEYLLGCHDNMFAFGIDN